MRAKLDPVLTAVAEEHEAGRLTWSQRDVQRLISPYPANKKADHVLAALGDDFYHDDIHALENGDDATAVADADQEASASSAEEDDEPVAPVDGIELHGDNETAVADEDMDIPMLSAEQADEVHKRLSTMATLEAAIELLEGTGQLRVVQVMQQELSKEKRKKRKICQESPAVAESFSRLRNAEHQSILRQQQLAQRSRALELDAKRAVQTKDDALAHLRETKRKIQDAESVSAARHCLNTSTLEQLGDSSATAGGGNGKTSRHDVLDRMARIKAGLSDAQRNDFKWFKDAWDKETVKLHGSDWAKLFMSWMQRILDDERSNAFSTFVFDETRRVFHDVAALHAPGY